MEIVLDKDKLSSWRDPAGNQWNYEPPWGRLQYIGDELGFARQTITNKRVMGRDEYGEPILCRQSKVMVSLQLEYFTGCVEITVNQGGLQNYRIISKLRDSNQVKIPHIIDGTEKENFKWAMENISRVHPEIPIKASGRLKLHYAERTLKKAVMTIK